VVVMFENAFKQQPINEELGAQTFFAHVRTGNWKSAQQVSYYLRLSNPQQRPGLVRILVRPELIMGAIRGLQSLLVASIVYVFIRTLTMTSSHAPEFWRSSITHNFSFLGCHQDVQTFPVRTLSVLERDERSFTGRQ
jgi:hypothetical protein